MKTTVLGIVMVMGLELVGQTALAQIGPRITPDPVPIGPASPVAPRILVEVPPIYPVTPTIPVGPEVPITVMPKADKPVIGPETPPPPSFLPKRPVTIGALLEAPPVVASSDVVNSGKELAGVRWEGSETLSGYGGLTFEFLAGGKVVMVDAKERLTGNYEYDGENVALRFHGGALVYTGKTTGDGASGTAADSEHAWNWSVRRKSPAAVRTEKDSEPGQQASARIPLGLWLAFGGVGVLALASSVGVLILWRSSARRRVETRVRHMPRESHRPSLPEHAST